MVANYRAAIYARVSTDMQRDNFSIPSQIAECLNYAQLKGYSVVGDRYVNRENGFDAPSGNGSIPAFVDDYSSRELSRPSIDAALDYLETIGFDVLVVHAIDRLARDPFIRQTLEREFIKRGARVEYALGNYEETPEGEVRKDLDATFAKWENARRVERSTRGKRRKAENGKFVGGRTPYGYMLDIDAYGGLEVNKKQAEVVQNIFDLYVDKRYSIGAITDFMNQSKVKTYTGSGRWHKSTIRSILENTVYIGTAYYNKFKTYSNSNRTERDRGEWIEIKVHPIIDQETFDLAQSLLEENREALRKKPTHNYLLSGMVRCAECERPYRANFRKARPESNRSAARSYRHIRGEEGCFNREMAAHRLEPLVWNKVVEFLRNPETIRERYDQALELEKSSQSRQRLLQEQYYRSVGKLEKQLENLTLAYTDPDIQMTKDEYLKQRSQFETELRNVDDRIRDLEQQLSKLPTRQEFETLERFAEEVRRRIDSPNWQLSFERQRHILEMLHIKVWVSFDYQIRITGWFGELDTLTYSVR
jgi:site-specific DNA recombinase